MKFLILKKIILIQIIILCLLKLSFANQCPKSEIAVDHKEAVTFLKNSLYTLHLQLTNENFSTPQANQSRVKIFDTIFNTIYWDKKLNSKSEFNVFWNWVRFQFWGLLQQQALLREDQGYKITNNPDIKQNFSKILKFPIYPEPLQSKNYICSGNEDVSYNCAKKMIQIDVILSPTLACSNTKLLENMLFSYILTQENSGWLVLDMKFKGKSLISESHIEFDNLINKYGAEKALNYIKIHLNKNLLIDADTKPENIGSTAFYKNYKIVAPAYPLSY